MSMRKKIRKKTTYPKYAEKQHIEYIWDLFNALG